MLSKLSILKARILICLMELQPENRNVTHLATLLNTTKSSISRSLDWFHSNGMISRDGRIVNLTEFGKKLTDEYRTKKDITKKWLLSEGVPEKIAENDAANITLTCSDETIESIKLHTYRDIIHNAFSHKQKFTGSEISALLGSGIYQFPFAIYKPSTNKGFEVSQLNDDFVHPVDLEIKNGNGLIFLRTKSRYSQYSPINIKLCRNLRTLKYFDGYSFKEAGKDGETFFFPISVLQFKNIGERFLFHGSVTLKIEDSMEQNHMNDVTSIFTMFISF